MDRNDVDVTEMSVVEELNNFIEKGLELYCECDDDEDVSRMETNATSHESFDISGCESSDDKIEKYCTPVKQIMDVSKKLEFPPHKELITPWTMNSKNINEILLQTYVSEVLLQEDSTNSTKSKNSSDQTENDSESSSDMFDNFIDSSVENGQPSTTDFDQTDLEQLSSLNLNLEDDSSSEDCLVDSSCLPKAFNSLVHELKDILQKTDELLEAMDSRPHWNRLVGKSNSPWKLNNPQMDLDSGLPTDKKPKILKQWTETRLKFSKLSAFLRESLYPCKQSSSEIMTFLADLKSTIMQCVDFNKVQDSLNLSENIQTAFDGDSDVRYMLNLERRILTIEVTLKNLTFGINKIYDDHEKEKKFQIIRKSI